MVEPSIYIFTCSAPNNDLLVQVPCPEHDSEAFFHVNMRAAHIQMIYSKNKI